MVRVSLLLALLAALAAAAPGTAAEQVRVASYCSETGDVCYGIFKVGAAYNFKLTLAAKYFSRYRICVKPLGKAAKCKTFPVKKTGAQWGGKVNWMRNFASHKPGNYRVSWFQGTSRLGPPLNFTLPAPA